MRLIKIFGLAALAAVAATAFIGASSASALTETQLCKVHTSLTCPAGEGTTSEHLVNVGVWKLLSSLGTVLCLTHLEGNTPLALGKPQLNHTLAAVLTGCGRNSAHTNCTMTAEELPLWDLLKFGLDLGLDIPLNGLLHLTCSGFPSLDCVYGMSSMEVERSGSEVVAEETPLEFVEGSFFCPESSSVDYTMVSLEANYVLK